MDQLLKAVRTQLTDVDLNLIVSLVDITSSLPYENVNYPCIVLEISSGGSGTHISGVTEATLRIKIYSKESKLELWTIYALVKGLLHNEERGVTTANRLIHVIYESKVDDTGIDIRNDVWVLEAEYTILYSTSTVVLTTGAIGAIYADAVDVTAVAGKKIGEFRGTVTLDIGFDTVLHSGQDRFNKTVVFNNGIVKFIFEEVIFKAAALNILWGITATVDTLADDATVSTSYTISQSTKPTELQVLWQGTKTDDGKRIEIEADKAVCPRLLIPFSKRDVVVHDCEWICLSDSSDNIVKVSVED